MVSLKMFLFSPCQRQLANMAATCNSWFWLVDF